MSLKKIAIVLISLTALLSSAAEMNRQEKERLAELACAKAKDQKIFELTETRRDKEYHCKASALSEKGKLTLQPSPNSAGKYILNIRFADHFDSSRMAHTNFRNCSAYVSSNLSKIYEIACVSIGDFPALR